MSYFSSLHADILEYATVLHKRGCLDEQADFWASDVIRELEEAIAAGQADAFPMWFASHFDDNRLQALADASAIAQPLGFKLAMLADFAVNGPTSTVSSPLGEAT